MIADALLAFWDGAFGSGFAFWSATLVRATPLLLVGLGVAVAFRAGVLNIGAEGQLLIGAAASTAVALAMDGAPRAVTIVAMAVAGASAGAAWAGFAAILRQRFQVLEVISTIMLNFIALYLVGWLVRGPLQEPTGAYPQSATLGAHAHWPSIIPGQRLHLGFALGLVAAGVVWWMIAHTASGFRARAVGASVRAAESAGGIDASGTIVGVFVASGALAGLAGASEVGGVTRALYEGISPGYGYTAIAVALLARLDARLVIVSAVFFGAMEAGAAAMQRDAGVPSVVVQVVVALTILGALLAMRWRETRLADARPDGAEE